MKNKLATITTTAIATILLASVAQQGNAILYYGHDGSVDKYLTKVKVEPYGNKKNTWTYLVKTCATDRSLALDGIVLKSDVEQHYQGINKFLGKGKCTYFGAVMKAKNENSLGAVLIEKHEALEVYQSLVEKGKSDGFKPTKSEQRKYLNELSYYRTILGGLV